MHFLWKILSELISANRYIIFDNLIWICVHKLYDPQRQATKNGLKLCNKMQGSTYKIFA